MYPGNFFLPRKNVGPIERVARFILSGVMIYWSVVVTSWWFIAAVYMSFTAVAAWCPFKQMLGIKHKLY